MPDAPPAGAPASLIRTFRRLLLVAMITAAATAGAFAVVLFLTGWQDDVAWRITGSLVCLAIFCGVAAVLVTWIDRHFALWLAYAGLALFSIDFALVMSSIWIESLSWEEEAFFTTLVLGGAFLLACTAPVLQRTGRWRWLIIPTLLACAVAAMVTILEIWDQSLTPRMDEWAGCAWVVALVLSLSCVVAAVRPSRRVDAARYITMALGWATGALVCFSILSFPMHGAEWVGRLLGALGTATGASLVIFLCLAVLDAWARRTAPPPGAIELELRCPRCMAMQRIHTGPAACASCGLKFTIKIDLTQCLKCGYALIGLPDRKCPECGTAF